MEFDPQLRVKANYKQFLQVEVRLKEVMFAVKRVTFCDIKQIGRKGLFGDFANSLRNAFQVEITERKFSPSCNG